ncbi:MAG: hypothetical protein ACERKX_04005 [Anaerolineales bacterium]
MQLRDRWFVVAIMAIAMAWLEAAVVMYLRFFIDRIDPYQLDPLPLIAELGEIELVREVATLVMLFCVGWLAGRERYSRLGYFLIAFGLWDIFYYVFLRVMGGWPETILDWDILFLLPLPWWGPVLAPVLVSLLMIVFGSLLSTAEGRLIRLAWWSWLAVIVGVFLALFVFMQEALEALPASIEIIRAILPVDFNWWLFSLAIFLLAVPILEVAFRLRTDRPRMLLHDR